MAELTQSESFDSTKTGPHAGPHVVDLGRVFAGPVCAALVA